MQRKGLIITNGYGLADGIKHQVARLKDEFFKLGVEIEVKRNNELLSYIENGNIKTSLPKYDFAMYLDKDRYVADLLERSGLRLFNKMESICKCDEDVLSCALFENVAVKFLEGRNKVTEEAVKEDETSEVEEFNVVIG